MARHPTTNGEATSCTWENAAAARGTLGLGLGPVSKVVMLHGGRVEAANPGEGGFTVHVVLPIDPPEPEH